MSTRIAARIKRTLSLTAATAAAIATLTAGIIASPIANAAPAEPATTQADLEAQQIAAQVAPAGQGDEHAKIGVLSDTHYYPANYADDNDDFHDYVGGDPKLLEESNAISEQAVQMIIKDNPDYVLVTGDLTKDGEQQAELDIAAKFREIQTETAKKGKQTKVFVINGNHDIYNTDAWNFHEGTGVREPAPLVDGDPAHTQITNDPHFQTKDSTGKTMTQGATDPMYFRYVMNDFGYGEAAQQESKRLASQPSHFFHNPGNPNTDFNDPAHYRDNDGNPTKVAGELSYYVDEGNFRFIAIDSGKYSPDAETGYDYNEHVTAGRIDTSLLPWISQVTKDADAQGKTVIGFLHHGIVPHFQDEDKTLSEYVVDNWQQVASTLADSGMRWMFTGHMHANDRADYVSPNGNPLTDIQTGALASYGTPVRYVDFYRGAEIGGDQGKRHAETMQVKTVSVGQDPDNPSKSVPITVHCGYGVTMDADPSGRWTGCTNNAMTINDLRAYTKSKLYGNGMITDMAVGTVRPMMEKIGKQGLQNYLAQEQPDLDLQKTVTEYLQQYLASPVTISGSGYTAQAWYANGALHLKGIGGFAGILGETTISDAQIMNVVYDLMAQIDTKFLQNPDYLAGQIKNIVDQVSAMQPVDGSGYTLVQLVSDLMTNHLQGAEQASGVNQDKISAGADAIAKGDIVRDVIDLLLDTIVPEGGNGTLDTITSQLTIDWSKAGLSGLWLLVLNAATSSGNLKSTLDTFGFDAAKIRSIVDEKVEEYMSPSFLTGMGGIFQKIIMQMATDSVGEDDVENGGEAITIQFTGPKKPFDPDDPTAGSGQPTQISMSLGKDTVKDRAFRWYARSFYGTDTDPATGGFKLVTKPGRVQVCNNADCSSVAATVDATAEQVVKPKTLLNLGLTSGYGKDLYTKYSAQVTNLTVGQQYWYRVSSGEPNTAGEQWSSATAFVTGASTDDDDTFSFLNVDDSQGMTKSDYDAYHATLTAAQTNLPGTAFTVHGGDVVDEGSNEDYWTWLLDGDQERSMAVTAATGNHEDKSHVEGVTDPNSIMSHFNIQNLNVPEQDQTTGTYYSYTYKNALFVVLNSNDLGADNAIAANQMAWAQQVVTDSNAKWKIIVLHKSPYSNGPHHADADVVAIRAQLTKFAATNHIDMVLSGHDHTYNRTDWLDRDGKKTDVQTSTQEYAGQNFTVVNNPTGTVYAIAGTAGVKNYQQHQDPAVESAVSMALTVPAYAGVTIDGDMLYYRAYKVENGQSVQIDSFAVNKGASTVEKTPAEKVIDQIAALPSASDVQTSDEDAIVAAETAYDALGADDRTKVTNYDKLVAVRKMLDALKAAGSGQATQACNGTDLMTALNAKAPVIAICGDFNVENDTGNKVLNVDQDTIIQSNGSDHTISQVEFHVRNGARLMLNGGNGTLKLDGARAWSSWYESIQPVVVEGNSTLVTRGNVWLQTKYGTGSDNGNAVNVAGDGATAVIGKGATLIGSEWGLRVSNAGATATIDDGQIYAFGTTNKALSYGGVRVDGGKVTINAGTVSSVYAASGSTLTINGGEFKDVTGGEVHQPGTMSRVQLDGNATAYVTGGHFTTIDGLSFVAGDSANVHMMPGAKGNLTFGANLASQPFVDGPTSANYKDVSVKYAPTGTSPALVSGQDGVYKASDGVSAGASLQTLAGDANATALTTTATDPGADGIATMNTTLEQGTSTVFGKVKLNNKGVDGLGGNGAFWVYGKSATFENNPVTKVAIDTPKPFVADLNRGNRFGLTAHVEPSNAHDLSLDWTSSDAKVAGVDAKTGVVTATGMTGITTVNVKSATYPDAEGDSIEFIAVKPSVSGAGAIDEKTVSTKLTADIGVGGEGGNATLGKHQLTWAWSVDQPSIATIDANGTLTKAGTGKSGTVTVYATVVLDGTPTDVRVLKTVSVASLASGQYYVEWYKKEGGVESGKDLPADKWTSPEAPAGKIFAGWFTDPQYTQPYEKTYGKAYAKFVDADLLTVKAQLADGQAAGANGQAAGANGQGETKHVRILSSMESMDYDFAQFDFSVDGSGAALSGGSGAANGAKRTATFKTNFVYDYVTVGGADGEHHLPKDVFADPTAKYFTTVLLRNVPKANYDTAITVTPSWWTLDGTHVTGTPRTLTVNELAKASAQPADVRQ